MGLSSLEWLLLTAAGAVLMALAVVVVQSVVRDVAVDTGTHSARLRAAVIAADRLTREWRSFRPVDESEVRQLNQRFIERCARLGITYADTEAAPRWKPGVLADGGGWHHSHNIPICHLRDVRGERERFDTD